MGVAVLGADIEFRVPNPCGFCKRTRSAMYLFDLTLSLLARYDVWQRSLQLSALGL